MKTHCRTEDDLILNVFLSGPYECVNVEEVALIGPDDEEWLFTEREAEKLGLIDSDIVEQLAYENAHELDMDYNLTQADILYDQWKERGL